MVLISCIYLNALIDTFRDHFYNAEEITPRGNYFWNAIFTDINWHWKWLIPFKLCVTKNYISKYYITYAHLTHRQMHLL